jgi:hypothetical protein
MNTKALLLETIDCAFDRQSWHGANLMSSLRGVRADDAAASIAGRKSIWQQVLHAAYWKHVIVNKLTGSTPFARRGSNWPKIPAETHPKIRDKRWRDDLAFLRNEHQQLRRAIRALPAKSLTARTIWRIHGVAAHDVYHAGQIKLLRRLLKGDT